KIALLPKLRYASPSTTWRPVALSGDSSPNSDVAPSRMHHVRSSHRRLCVRKHEYAHGHYQRAELRANADASRAANACVICARPCTLAGRRYAVAETFIL